MGLFDSIGGLFGGSGATTTTNQQFNLSPQQQALQDQLLQQNQRFQQQPFQQFGGPRTQQFGDQFQQGADRLTNLDPQLLGNIRQSAGGLGIGQDFLQNFLGQQGPGGGLDFNAENIQRFSDPFTQQVIDAQGRTFDRFRDRASQDIGDQATFGGFQGGSREAIQRGARLGELDAAQANQEAQLRSSGFDRATNALFGQQGRFDQFQGQQLGQAGNLANLGFGANQQLQNILQQAGLSGLNIGQLQQALGQQGIDREREKFGEQRQFGLENLGVNQSVLGGLPQQGSTTQTEQTQGSGNALTGLLGLGGTIFGGPLGGIIGNAAGSLFGGGGGGGGQQALPEGGFLQNFNPAGGNLIPPSARGQGGIGIGQQNFGFPVLRAGG